MSGSLMTSPPSGSAIEHEAVARSLQFLQSRWHEPIKVSDLVRVSAMSRRGFAKAFERHTGSRPKLELSRLRLDHARRLLAETELPLARIAARCGYQSANSLLVAFKREYQLTPAEFRSRRQEFAGSDGSVTADTLSGHWWPGSRTNHKPQNHRKQNHVNTPPL